MREILKRSWVFVIFSILCLFGLLNQPHAAFAHEQYVLTPHELNVGLADTTTHVLDVFKKPENLVITTEVGIGIGIVFILFFLFQYSPIGRKLGSILEKLDPVGHVLLRIAFAGSLLASAYYHSYLGPEIPITSIPGGNLLIPIMYVCGLLLLFGFFTRVVSFIALLILIASTFVYGEYMTTYLNYYGELIALVIFGSYILSVDNKLFGISPLVKKYQNLEILLIRITYGISVMYPAVTLKLLHPAVIVEIVNKYHMNQIHWLFPQDPLLISLGTGFAQIFVGLLIIVGFETRYASFVTFWLYFLSVLFFKEAVWPHYILLALALYLSINNGGSLTLDTFVGKFLEKQLGKKRIKKVAQPHFLSNR